MQHIIGTHNPVNLPYSTKIGLDSVHCFRCIRRILVRFWNIAWHAYREVFTECLDINWAFTRSHGYNKFYLNKSSGVLIRSISVLFRSEPTWIMSGCFQTKAHFAGDINLSTPGEAYIRHLAEPTLGQVMDCFLFNADLMGFRL